LKQNYVHQTFDLNLNSVNQTFDLNLNSVQKIDAIKAQLAVCIDVWGVAKTTALVVQQYHAALFYQQERSSPPAASGTVGRAPPEPLLAACAICFAVMSAYLHCVSMLAWCPHHCIVSAYLHCAGSALIT
jgi:hypothetical protein